MRAKLDLTRSDSWNLRHLAFAELAAARRIATDTARAPEKRVHGARRRCKSARSLLRLFAPAFPEFEAENAAIRDAAKALSAVRESAVLDETFAVLVADEDLCLRPSFTKEVHHLLRRRAPADRAERHVLAAFTAAIETSLQRAPGWSLTSEGIDVIVTGAAKTYKRARTEMRAARDRRVAADLHEWRKQVKHHLYHLNLMRGMGKLSGRKRRRSLDALGDALGHHHDLDGLYDRLATVPGARKRDLATLFGAIERHQDRIAAQSLKLGKSLFGPKPRQFREDLARALRRKLPD